MPYELVFNDVDLQELEHLLDSLFADNSLYFERLVSALSRLGLRVTLNSAVSLYPSVELARKKVVDKLKKGMSHVQKNKD